MGCRFLSLQRNCKDIISKKCCGFYKKAVNLKKNRNQDWCRFSALERNEAVESTHSHYQSHPISSEREENLE